MKQATQTLWFVQEPRENTRKICVIPETAARTSKDAIKLFCGGRLTSWYWYSKDGYRAVKCLVKWSHEP